MPIDDNPNFVWFRKCQECDHKQESREPPKNDERAYSRYCDAKCANCKSAGLDYGKWIDVGKDD